jgi:hypothetical protein
MANDNLPAERPTTDIIGKDAETLKRYIEIGMPNIGSILPDNIMRMFEMYVSGKNYIQISNITRIPKVAILFLSQRHDWFQKRMDMFDDMAINTEKRLQETKLSGQNFLIDWNQAEQTRMQRNIDKYRATGDEKFLDNINGKSIERWMKSFDLMHKTGGAANLAKQPLVGINVGEGATLTRTSDNTIEVTPKQKAMGNMLKELANQRREEEKKKE